ncbi:ArgP/LysG family DNA-binding transcriptional regulator [Reinekea marinisedimentorum]|uniref:LysR family transcriptional regulator (Chromosome initiation inhibitor) n=1 Tax=Reinekea marinisedimentorum TaxID=230495 RepID=A0A4R3IBZ2_9GAMM|nr:ArgP/LysG family DNA-binding transcriptional regulator [Reinekea marinisedimentorum]TCS43066.1 LysR family transcriptional regulator (chromosome initiation inhibitor) [Reinekea marinisedimentorum]
MLDYRALEALAAVVSQRGFEKAANILHVSQSAVSQRIKQLEAQLGQPVILRQTPPVATPLGLKLITHLQTVQHLEADLGLHNQATGRVHARIALSADAIATWFGEALGRITDEVDVDLILTDQDKGIELMRGGEVLATLCADGTPINGARVDRLGMMRYRAYANQDFLTRFNLINDFDNLHKAPALIFNEDDQLQHRFLALLNQPAPQNPIKCPSTEGFIQLAATGCGFGLMPEIQVNQSILYDRLIDIAPDHYLDVPLYWHSWRSSGEVMKRLRSSVIKTAHRWLRFEY